MTEHEALTAMHRTALHPLHTTLVIAALMAFVIGASPIAPLAAQELPPPTPTVAAPQDTPPDAAAPQTTGFTVYLPLVTVPEPYPPVNRSWELEFIRLLNEERARHGLHPLREHPLLTLAARRHAYDVGINQVPRGYCSHFGTDGTWPWHRMEWADYPGRYDGEAISCGKHDVASAVRGLLNSPPHRAFLLSPIPVEVSVGTHPIITNVDWMQGAYSTVMLGGTPNP